MPEAEWTHLALSDLLSIIDHISDHDPVAAQQIKDGIESRVATLHMGEPRIAEADGEVNCR
ncbi:type II toxin-antitoxin system RelE/ParE family toxin [Aurantiacibacter flavus]|uniref:Type II toxin-antitoxin system RelE/ParE family toxin n=1 Tax=Aurantiacibacter flavus TaxID=3145232 RepID=A0ABV0D0V6_9SPHN